MLAHGSHDVLYHRERGEQRTLLKQHADERGLFCRTDRPDPLVAQENVPGVRPAQAGERLEQNRFPRTRRAYNADDFAWKDIEVDLVVHDLLAKAVDDAARREYRFTGRLLGAHMPSRSNKMENNASSTMTRKIALTTARVVSWPTLSADPVTLSPCMQPMTPMKKAKIGALNRPTKRSQPSTAFRTRSRYCSADTSRSDREIIAPPSKPIMSEKNASSGRAITRAINRGTTRTCKGSMPITLSASISSRNFITPISAAKAEPERPATKIAVIKTPISRNTDTATRLTVKSSPPNGRNCAML